MGRFSESWATPDSPSARRILRGQTVTTSFARSCSFNVACLAGHGEMHVARGRDGDAEYEFGLDLILEGLKKRLRAR